MRAGVALVLLTVVGCNRPPFGEVLVVVDTDVSVPRLVSRLRADFFATDGTWFDSRDVALPDPADWPASFSVVNQSAQPRRVRLRLRAYPEGSVRDYRGDAHDPFVPWVEPPVAQSLAALCADPPLLAPGLRLTQRRGARSFTAPIDGGDCTGHPMLAGSVAARVEITQADTYRFEVVDSYPDAARGLLGGDPILFLRTRCDDAQSQLACDDDIDSPGLNFLSRIVIALTPGTYFLVTNGGASSPADLTLRYTRAADWDAAPPPPAASPPPAEPRLIAESGDDVTPATEPAPGVAIDRLIELTVEPQTRRTASVILRGECDGDQADLAAGSSCALPGDELVLREGIDRGGPSVSGTWSAEAAVPCSVAARDDEVCVPGGAFILGSSHIVDVADHLGVPEQPVVVEPFLLDRHEVTVGRYRQAVRDGFVSPDSSPKPAVGVYSSCTFSTAPDNPQREQLPLTCMSWYAARALCRFFGGDLPTHAQWEYAASAAGRPGRKSFYPWGDDAPDCERAAFGRGLGDNACTRNGYGAVAVDALPWSGRDVTALGVIGMAGNTSELALDAYYPYSHPCWRQARLRGVGCFEENAPLRSLRGGSWVTGSENLRSAMPLAAMPGDGLQVFFDGVRCARAGR